MLKPSHTPQDANLHAGVQIAATDAPMPLSARLRAQAPWLLAALAIIAVVALLAWPR